MMDVCVCIERGILLILTYGLASTDRLFVLYLLLSDTDTVCLH